jgi:hypothetical protein
MSGKIAGALCEDAIAKAELARGLDVVGPEIGVEEPGVADGLTGISDADTYR